MKILFYLNDVNDRHFPVLMLLNVLYRCVSHINSYSHEPVASLTSTFCFPFVSCVFPHRYRWVTHMRSFQTYRRSSHTWWRAAFNDDTDSDDFESHRKTSFPQCHMKWRHSVKLSITFLLSGTVCEGKD